jgi:soluble lytic murein transglycosylase-like protein
MSAGPVNNPATVALIVRSDLRTGRLVRSVARPARPALEKAPKKAAPQIELPPEPDDATSAFAKLVDEISARHAVDRDLVHSMIQVESNYNPFAVSNKGALGLMQLVPSTARRFGVSDSFNPTQNLEGGVRYMRYLLDHYKGDNRLALAAYNAGEGTVERFGGVPPFPETRSYVNRVGKALSDTKEAQRQQKPDASSETFSGSKPILAFMDATGRIYYKNP